jgi:hypothetical protein
MVAAHVKGRVTMSIRWMRSAQIANGKMMEALAWAKETAGYVEKKVGSKVEVWMDAFGNVGTVRWSADFTDFAAVEKAQLAIMTDQGYHQLVEKAFKNGLYLDGQSVDIVSRSV